MNKIRIELDNCFDCDECRFRCDTESDDAGDYIEAHCSLLDRKVGESKRKNSNVSIPDDCPKLKFYNSKEDES